MTVQTVVDDLLLEFDRHRGETVLGLGHEPGTDWVGCASRGAEVIVCSPWRAQLDAIQNDFERRHLHGQFLTSHPTEIPLDDSSVDVVCLNSLPFHADQLSDIVSEIYRVLKPGGKLLAMFPAKYDVDFWFNTWFFWHAWIDGRRKPGTSRRQGRYSSWQLGRLFGKFVNRKIRKRQLHRSEVPRVWRWLPTRLLARLMGRTMVVKGFKPLREM